MKKLALMLCVVASTLSLAACQSAGGDAGSNEYAAPYADDRTAGGEQDASAAPARAAEADRSFSAAQNK